MCAGLQRGHRVCGVDRELVAAQAMVQALAPSHRESVELIQADLEGAAWPLVDASAHRHFDAVVVTNYLWRPLMPDLLQSLAPGGVLLYETFAAGNETVGRPARADFLLRPGELLQVCKDLHVVAYEHGFATAPERFVQRIAAVRPTSQNLTPGEVRGHALSG